MATTSPNIQSLVSTLFCSPLTAGPAIRKVKKKILLFSLYSSLTCMFPGFEGTLCPFHERLKTKFRRFALWFIFINQLQGSIVVTILQVAVDIFKNMIPLFLIFFLCLLCGGFWKTYGPIILFTTTIYNALFSSFQFQTCLLKVHVSDVRPQAGNGFCLRRLQQSSLYQEKWIIK